MEVPSIFLYITIFELESKITTSSLQQISITIKKSPYIPHLLNRKISMRLHARACILNSIMLFSMRYETMMDYVSLNRSLESFNN